MKDTGSHNVCDISCLNPTRTRSRRVGLLDICDLDTEYRFWSKVAKGAEEACWPWLASAMDRYGHGQFTVRAGGVQHHFYAHRCAWEFTHGRVPNGKNVLHRCDVGRCCNPAHLFLGSQDDNMKDAARKGRLPGGGRKLSDWAYLDIATSTEPAAVLADRYGVRVLSISRIRNGHQGAAILARVRASGFAQSVRFVRLPVRGDLHLSESRPHTAESSMQLGRTPFHQEFA